ncbi:hypothetical protein P4123_31015 [Pseudomonas aeruginosa]|nr:hypothetical protein [Pseudomonas aeruginosa]
MLERLFFEEVAPVCHGNLLSPAPAVWTAFDEGMAGRGHRATPGAAKEQRPATLARALPGRLAAMAIRRHLARDRRRSLSERLSEIPNG